MPEATRYLFDDNFNFVGSIANWIPEAKLRYWLFNQSEFPEASGWYEGVWATHARRVDWMGRSNDVPEILKASLLLLKG